MIDDILDNRPKQQTDEAVEEWLKHNKPTVLADFERIKPKSKVKRQPVIYAKVRKKADAVVNRIRNEGLTYSRFVRQHPLLMRRVKRAIKEQYGLILADVTKTIATTKQVRVMELSR